jgi:hypothetical protein
MSELIGLIVLQIFAATADVSLVPANADCQSTVQEFSKGAKFVQVETNPELQEVYYSLVGKRDVIYIVCGNGEPDDGVEPDNGDETDGEETPS